MAYFELLKESDLFSNLPDYDLEFIMTRTAEQNFSTDEVIFSKGGAAIHFFIVKSGEVILTQIQGEERHEMAKYQRGDSFGEFAFITSGLHNGEAKAARDTILLVFPSIPNTLDSISHENPGLVSRLYMRCIVILSNRLQSIHSLIAENSTWVKAMQEQIYIDQLTGLYTKAFLDSEIARLLNPPVSLIILKPDKFKELNDTFGHKAGDAVLERIGNALLELTDNRPGWAIRLRGNEMAVILQQFDRSRTLEIAKTLAFTITDSGPKWEAPIDLNTSGENKIQKFRLTVSIAFGIYKSKDQNWQELVDTTYKLMQRAWKEGGNKIYGI